MYTSSLFGLHQYEGRVIVFVIKESKVDRYNISTQEKCYEYPRRFCRYPRKYRWWRWRYTRKWGQYTRKHWEYTRKWEQYTRN